MNALPESLLPLAFPELRTERLLLRRFQPSDLENVFRGLSHPDVINYYGVNYTSLEDTQTQLDWFWANERQQTGIWWAVCSADNQLFYGAGGLSSISLAHKKAEIGFWLLPEYWGQGIMPEAMPLIFGYAFGPLGLHRIEGLVETENEICKKAVRKLHFTHEGTMVDCEIKNGRYISLDIFAKLNDTR
ncbi:GNAT family N-acetyltransferase [Rufibacter ruber]|uniref:GNAT family N-acetyltransferase n=1 Tax=Rufibacter ruber TaxID=1783499 RepID=UPI0008365CD6|nr:GNAT family N-acetyltransferase [Rufibacter ruber]